MHKFACVCVLTRVCVTVCVWVQYSCVLLCTCVYSARVCVLLCTCVYSARVRVCYCVHVCSMYVHSVRMCAWRNVCCLWMCVREYFMDMHAGV